MKLVLISILLVSLNTFADDDQVRSVKVFGECHKKLETDRGSITITVTNTHKDIKKATWETNDKYNKLKSLVAAMNLKDKEIETANYNVFEKKEWQNKKYVSKGFTAEAALKVSTSEISRVGEVIATANKLKIERIGSLQTFVSKDLQKKEYENCLAVASKNALAKAKQLASTLNAKVGEVLRIDESFAKPQSSPIRPMMEFAMAKSSRAAAAPEVTGKKVDFSVKVDVEFRLK